MRDAVILADLRAAVGSFGGCLCDIPAPTLGAIVMAALVRRRSLDLKPVDEVIPGQEMTAGGGQNRSLQIVIKAGLPHSVPAMTLKKFYGSGLKATNLLIQATYGGAVPRRLAALRPPPRSQNVALAVER